MASVSTDGAVIVGCPYKGGRHGCRRSGQDDEGSTAPGTGGERAPKEDGPKIVLPPNVDVD
jgi:hypothetical protein